MENKDYFVSQFLKPLLMATDKCINNAVYKTSEQPDIGLQGKTPVFSSEYVEVTYVTGAVKVVDVTFDNYKALARDVLSQI